MMTLPAALMGRLLASVPSRLLFHLLDFCKRRDLRQGWGGWRAAQMQHLRGQESFESGRISPDSALVNQTTAAAILRLQKRRSGQEQQQREGLWYLGEGGGLQKGAKAGTQGP